MAHVSGNARPGNVRHVTFAPVEEHPRRAREKKVIYEPKTLAQLQELDRKAETPAQQYNTEGVDVPGISYTHDSSIPRSFEVGSSESFLNQMLLRPPAIPSPERQNRQSEPEKSPIIFPMNDLDVSGPTEDTPPVQSSFQWREQFDPTSLPTGVEHSCPYSLNVFEKTPDFKPTSLPYEAQLDCAIAWFGIYGEKLSTETVGTLLSYRYRHDPRIANIALKEVEAMRLSFFSPRRFGKQDAVRLEQLRSTAERLSLTETQTWKKYAKQDIMLGSKPKLKARVCPESEPNSNHGDGPHRENPIDIDFSLYEKTYKLEDMINGKKTRRKSIHGRR